MYRTAVLSPLTADDIDPDRVYPDKEYPRWSSKPTDYTAREIETKVNWRVVIAVNEQTYVETVELYVCATPYTTATDDAGVLRYEISSPGHDSDETLVDQALRFAFD
jgi:hypothetical protein